MTAVFWALAVGGVVLLSGYAVIVFNFRGDRVIELASFGHYFTTMLTAAVGPSGMVYMFDLPYTEARAGETARVMDDPPLVEPHLSMTRR